MLGRVHIVHTAHLLDASFLPLGPAHVVQASREPAILREGAGQGGQLAFQQGITPPDEAQRQ
jgi:hypothetical protein